MPDDLARVPYPTHWEADVVLRDGGTAHVRPIRPDDADALQAFHTGQSERSTYFRFFAPVARLGDADLHRFTNVDHHDRVALVVVAEQPDDTGAPGERIIAVGRYERIDERAAEVAFNVADDHQGRGLGSMLLEHLAAAARERGVERFTADVLPQNTQMIAVFRHAGYAVSQRLDDGVLTVSFDIDPTETSRAVMADREHRAEARSVRGLLTPRSVLVVAEDEPATGTALADAVARHLLAVADGPDVHVVGLADVPGPRRPTVHPSPADVPGTVDLLVLAVPAARAAAVVRACAHLRPRGVLVLTAGFAEAGEQGRAHQRELLRAAHAAGMRVLGPASFGFVRAAHDGAPAVDVSLAGRTPAPGRLGLMCQSAQLAVELLASAERRGLGLSTFVSAGHRADVSGNDVMQFWTQDDATDVVGLLLESIGNARKFARVARRLAATKPVVALIAGRSGHVLPPGHALRRTRVPRRALDELLQQAGVIRVGSTHQLMDVVQLLVHQPLPSGNRVAVVAGSDALVAIAAEAASSAGLTVTAHVTLPVPAVTTPASAAEDDDALDAVLADLYDSPDHDAVVVAHVPLLGGADPRVTRAVAAHAARTGRTTVASVVGLSGTTEALTAPDPDGVARTVPAYATPVDAALALGDVVRYAAWRAADHGQPLHLGGSTDRGAARRIVAEHVRGDEVVTLDRATTMRLLACYGIDVWPHVVVRDADEAVAAAERLGWPVVLKSSQAALRHRIDLGGVRLDLTGPGPLREAVELMGATLDRAGVPPHERTFEVQRMAPPGTACVVRSAEDPRFGPVVSFGVAGDAVDLLDDVSHRIAPLTDADVAAMVRSVRAAPKLFGWRGLPVLDVAALEDVLARVAVLADDLPEVHDLELYPVLVADRGAAVLAARVRLAVAGRVDGERRALPG